jgi:hypothetical protein
VALQRELFLNPGVFINCAKLWEGKNLYISFFSVVLYRDILWHLQEILQYIKYITLEFTPYSTLFYPLPLSPFLEYFQQVSFLHLHTRVHIFYTVFTFLYPFPTTSSSHWCNPPSGQDLFHPSVLRFCRRKE